MSELVLVRREGAVGHLVINRPEMRNAINREVIRGLIAGIDELEADESVRVIVVTGAGDKAFCAGGDMRPEAGAGFLAMHEGRGEYAKMLLRIRECGKIVVARVNGHALGGGLGLALACDLVIAVDKATFGTPEIKLGLFPMMVMALLARHLPRKRLSEMMFLGQRLDAAEAVRLGLANHAVPADRLDAKVAEITADLAAKSTAVLRLGKKAFRDMEDMSLDQALSYLHGALSINAMTEDAMEGVTAFLEKRSAEWKDR